MEEQSDIKVGRLCTDNLFCLKQVTEKSPQETETFTSSSWSTTMFSLTNMVSIIGIKYQLQNKQSFEKSL